jgi:hypothetical protein
MSTTNNISNTESFSFLPERKNSFVVPDNYFETLTKRILNKVGFAEEMRAFEMLSEIEKKKVFTLPADYFNANEQNAALELADFKFLSTIPKPEFENLSAAYTQKLKAAVINKKEIIEEAEKFTKLTAVEKQNPFVILPDYFDRFPEKVKQRIHAKNESASVFGQAIAVLFKPKMVLAYSIAAVIVLIVYLYKPGSFESSGDCKTLACLEKRELLNEHNINDFDEENLYDLVDVDVLSNNLSGGDSILKKQPDTLLKK